MRFECLFDNTFDANGKGVRRGTILKFMTDENHYLNAVIVDLEGKIHWVRHNRVQVLGRASFTIPIDKQIVDAELAHFSKFIYKKGPA